MWHQKEQRERVMKHEGLRLKPYHDTVGKLTIGYGRNLDDVGISKDEAEMLLSHDLDLAWETFDRNHPEPEFRDMDKVRKGVLVDMIFNMGIRKFHGFKRMLAAVKRQQFLEAAYHALDSLWATQVGSRANELAGILYYGDYNAPAIKVTLTKEKGRDVYRAEKI